MAEEQVVASLLPQPSKSPPRTHTPPTPSKMLGISSCGKANEPRRVFNLEKPLLHDKIRILPGAKKFKINGVEQICMRLAPYSRRDNGEQISSGISHPFSIQLLQAVPRAVPRTKVKSTLDSSSSQPQIQPTTTNQPTSPPAHQPASQPPLFAIAMLRKNAKTRRRREKKQMHKSRDANETDQYSIKSEAENGMKWRENKTCFICCCCCL